MHGMKFRKTDVAAKNHLVFSLILFHLMVSFIDAWIHGWVDG